MKRVPFQTTIRGKRVWIRHELLAPTDEIGQYVTKPGPQPATIRISPEVEEAQHLDTVIHETLHACFPDISEDAIDDAGAALTRLLWRLGYRLEGGD